MDIARELLDRVKREYVEMPDMALTGQQIRRLWNLDGATCDQILAVLVEERFLAQSRDGVYSRFRRH